MMKGTGQASRSVGSQVFGRATSCMQASGTEGWDPVSHAQGHCCSEKCESALMLLSTAQAQVSRKTEQAAGTGMRCRFQTVTPPYYTSCKLCQKPQQV